jgi:hypothetical protein
LLLYLKLFAWNYDTIPLNFPLKGESGLFASEYTSHIIAVGETRPVLSQSGASYTEVSMMAEGHRNPKR